jgi:hypothetical protein
MSFYSRIADKAYSAFKKRGTAITLRRTAIGVIDENTGALSASVVSDYNGYGIVQYFDSKSSQLMYGTNTLKDTLIHKEDLMIMFGLENKAITPTEVIDALIIGGVTYNVVNALPLKPGNEAVFYNVHVRK